MMREIYLQLIASRSLRFREGALVEIAYRLHGARYGLVFPCIDKLYGSSFHSRSPGCVVEYQALLLFDM